METKIEPAIGLSTDAPQTQTPQPAINFKRLAFHGKTGEFFSIWIVNLLLSIVTLGIYSAWAKVRTNRYFYSNLEADGHRFSYLAEPMQILRGRILAVLIFAAYYLAASLNPIAAGVMMVIMIGLTPWLICQSFKFNLRMTSYRNVRFGFHGTYGGAFLVFLVYPVLSVFTLYLAMPFAIKEMNRFIIDNTSFGEKKFESALDGGFYWVTAFISGIFGAVIVGGMVFVVVMFGGFDLSQETQVAGEFDLFGILILVAYFAAIFISGAYYTSRIRNHMFNNSEIPGIAKFSSDVSFGALAWLRVSNLLALVCTLGFAYPWVKIRSANFFAGATEMLTTEEAEQVIEAATEQNSAFGEEAADVFDLDVSLV